MRRVEPGRLGRGILVPPPRNLSAWPLSVHASGRYLVNPQGQPFLINECSSWGLIQSLTYANFTDYVDRRVAQGFNTMKISVISYDQSFPGSPPNWQGNPPFSTPGDFSTAATATAYWAHVDACLDYLYSKNVLVILMPAYLGYSGDATQGWSQTMNADTDAHMTSYGTFLGNRFLARKNIIYCAGGDQVPGTGIGQSTITSRVTSIINAIIAADPSKYWTAHWAGDYALGTSADDPQPGGMLSTDYAPLASIMNLNGHYGYNPQVPVYTRIEAGRAITPALPVFALDESYDSNGISQPQGDPLSIRTKAHRAMCSGACGSAYCNGSTWFRYTDWVSGSQSQNEAVYWWNFWSTVPWSSMAPDLTSQYVTAGRGTHGNDDWICVLASSTWLVAHFPNGGGRTITVDMSRFSAARVAYWWDPTSDVSTPINGGVPFANTGTQNFSQPSSSDVLLLLRD